MNDNEFIKKFLDIDQPMESEPTRFSTLALLIRGARQLTGRDVITGKYEFIEFNEKDFANMTVHSFQFLGLISYLIFLEQLGSIFRPRDKETTLKKNDIFCALTYFAEPELGEIEKNSIRALRNSLAHKFGLATEKKPLNGFKAKFSLCYDRNGKVIGIPSPGWEGSFLDKTDETSTIVYVYDLIDLIERIYKKAVEENNKGNLELILADKMDELKTRYTVVY
jgi:hypothetical protein